jgi:AraC family transcriptional regulator
VDIAVRLVEHHVWLVDDLVDRAEGHQAGTLDARISIRSLLSRLVGQLETWLAAAEGKEPPEAAPESFDELRLRHGEAGRRFVELVRGVVREDRAEDAFWAGSADHPDVLTYGGMIGHVLVVGGQLRAQAIDALRRAGAADPRYGDPMLFLTG